MRDFQDTMGQPEVASDPDQFQKLARESAALTSAVDLYDTYEATLISLEEARNFLKVIFHPLSTWQCISVIKVSYKLYCNDWGNTLMMISHFQCMTPCLAHLAVVCRSIGSISMID